MLRPLQVFECIFVSRWQLLYQHCVCVCVCVCVLTGVTPMCRRLKKWLGWMFAPTYWARPLDEQLSFITVSCQPLSLSLSLSLFPIFANTLFLYNLLSLQLARFSSMSFSNRHGAVILSALHQPIDSPIFARPWTNACMPISLCFLPHLPSPQSSLLFFSSK